MINTDRLIQDLLLQLQEAEDQGKTEIVESLTAILRQHGTLLRYTGRYTFAVASAAVYTGVSCVRQRIGPPEELVERVMSEPSRVYKEK